MQFITIDYQHGKQAQARVSGPSLFLTWFYTLIVHAEYWMLSKALMLPERLARGLGFLIVPSATAGFLLGSFLENLARITAHNLALPFKSDTRKIYWASPLRKGEVTPRSLASAVLLYVALVIFLGFYEAASLPLTLILITVCTVSNARRMWSVNLLLCDLAESQARLVLIRKRNKLLKGS